MNYLASYWIIGFVLLGAIRLHHHFRDRATNQWLAHLQGKRTPPRSRMDRLIRDWMGPLAILLLSAFVWPVMVAIWVKDKMPRREPEDECEEKVFSVMPKDLVRRWTREEIEAQEIITDPLSAVPPLPFGHLHIVWLRFTEQMTDTNELWSFVTNWEDSWGEKSHRVGYAIVREGDPIKFIVTKNGPSQ